jgi:hypothetical protein
MKQVTFGNTTAILVNDLDTKNKVINYLFNTIDLKAFRFNMLDSIKQLEYIRDNPHFVSPNFKGFSYYLIFTNVNNHLECFAIDKKKLSYHKDKINMKYLSIYKIKVDTFKNIYRGTIFDCKMLKNSGKYLMLINDCYTLMGSKTLSMKLDEKMKYINNIISNKMTSNCCDNFVFKVNKLYEYSKLKDLIENIIPKCKLEINGLVFYPEFSGITKIYINKETKPKEKISIESNENVGNESYNMIKEFKNFLKARNYSYEKNGDIKKLLIEKTDITDVYNVYCNKTNKKLGIAHIPNLKTSIYCSDIFSNTKKELFKCIYNDKFKKWIPLETV